MFQNLTRAFPPMTNAALFGWLQTLYPLWSTLDEEAANVSAWVGLAELALSGCTTSTDHLYVHPAGGGDLLSAEILAAEDLGMRFHPTRGSMSLSQKMVAYHQTMSCRITTLFWLSHNAQLNSTMMPRMGRWCVLHSHHARHLA